MSGDAMPPEAKALYAIAKAAHEKIYRLTQALNALLRTADIETATNVAYAAKEAEKWADDARKVTTGTRALAEKVACAQWTTTSVDGEPIRTAYVTATPDMKTCAVQPKRSKNPEQYAALMSWLGIDPVLWDSGTVLTDEGENETEVVRVHYPGLKFLLTRLQANGHQLPDGISQGATWTEYILRFKQKKGITLDETAENPF